MIKFILINNVLYNAKYTIISSGIVGDSFVNSYRQRYMYIRLIVSRGTDDPIYVFEQYSVEDQ